MLSKHLLSSAHPHSWAWEPAAPRDPLYGQDCAWAQPVLSTQVAVHDLCAP